MTNPKHLVRTLIKKPWLHKNSSNGSVSMEYIIVSCFALLMSVTAVSWLGRLVKERINNISERMNVDTTGLDLDFDQGFGAGE